MRVFGKINREIRFGINANKRNIGFEIIAMYGRRIEDLNFAPKQETESSIG
jgi:hypothetical protein